MLEPMEKDAAIEVMATIRANLYHHKTRVGDSEQINADRQILLTFKNKVRFEFDDMTWSEVLAFSKEWLTKYPCRKGQQAAT